MMSVTSLTPEIFNQLLAHFKPICDTTHIRANKSSGGAVQLERRLLDAAGVLGLCLSFLRSSSEMWVHGLLFGLIPSSVTHYLDFGMGILWKLVKILPQCEITWPTPEKIKYCANIFAQHQPLIEHGFCVIDGLNLRIQQPSDSLQQNAVYNGWLHGTFTSGVFAFLPTGEICFAAYNFPGACHDSTIARVSGLYTLLSEVPHPYYALTDSAFATGGDLLCSSKTYHCSSNK